MKKMCAIVLTVLILMLAGCNSAGNSVTVGSSKLVTKGYSYRYHHTPDFDISTLNLLDDGTFSFYSTCYDSSPSAEGTYVIQNGILILTENDNNKTTNRFIKSSGNYIWTPDGSEGFDRIAILSGAVFEPSGEISEYIMTVY